jgi:hypothetical protein
MTNTSGKEMVCVYDIRRDEYYKKTHLPRWQRQWRAFESGKLRVEISEGLITKLFFAPYEGDHFFEVGDGKRHRAWIRRGDASWYAVGRRVKVEHLVFRRWFYYVRWFCQSDVPEIPVVSKIWIGDDDASHENSSASVKATT